MGKKIDISKIEGAQLRDSESPEVKAGEERDDLAYLKSLGARALPDSPTANGWSASAIKKQLYRQPEVLFMWLKRLAEADESFANAVDTYLDGIAKGKSTPKVYATLDEAKQAVADGAIEDGSVVFVSNADDTALYCLNGAELTMVGDTFKEVAVRIHNAETELGDHETRLQNVEAFTKAAVFASSVGISEYDEATGNVYIVTADESKLDFEYADGVLTCSITVNAEGE